MPVCFVLCSRPNREFLIWSKSTTANFLGPFPRRVANVAADTDAGGDGPPSVARTIADAYHTEVRLDLSKEDISFIAGIYMYLRLAEEPNLDDATLRSIYVPLNEPMNGDPKSMQQRCTRAVTRLKTLSILVRADYRGISSGGEFSVTSFSYAIADFVLRESNLTVQSLKLLLSRIRTELARVIDVARQGGDQTRFVGRHVKTF